jgi:hypothetical protein
MSAVLAVALVAGPAGAQSLKEDTSLGLAPADVSFYTSLQRGGEIGRRLMDSNAYSRIRNSSLVQFGMMMLQMQAADPNNPLAQAKSVMTKPENQELQSLLCDMLSHEMFCYGDRNWGQFLETYYDVYGEVYSSLQDPEMTQRLADGDETVGIEILESVIQRLPELQIPASVTGFKVRDGQQAASQIERLESVLRPLIDSVPELEGALKRRSVGGGEHLVLTLTGKMIPWDEVQAGFESGNARSAANREVFEQLKAEIEDRKLVITLGIHGDYVLLTTGPNLRQLKQIGQGELLIDVPEMAPVVALADKPLVGVSYASKQFMEYAGFGASTVDLWVEAGKTGARSAAAEEDLDDALLEKILADIDEAGEDLKGLVPEAGAVLDVTYLTDRGLEGAMYQHGGCPCLDGDEPLSLLNHVGGDPLCFTVCRSHWLDDNYDLITKWVGRARQYADIIAKSELGERKLAHYNKAMDVFWPLLEQIDQINREFLLPAFADGQGALVLDSKPTSTQWCDDMAPAIDPLPLPELAVVCGVSDPEKLKEGVKQFIDVINTALDEAHTMYPGEMPPISLPYPQQREGDGGAMYYYQMPASAEVDERILPNAGLSGNVATLAVTPDHTRRLLEKTSPPTEGPLADVDGPLAAATYMNWSAMMDMIEPWIAYASGLENYEAGDAGEDDVVVPDPGVVSTLGSVMDVLRCFHCYASTTAVEDGVTITRYEMHFQDLADDDLE